MADETQYAAGVKITLDASQAEKAAETLAQKTKKATDNINSLRDKTLGAVAGFAKWSASQVGVQLGLMAVAKMAWDDVRALGALEKSITGTIVASANWKDTTTALQMVSVSAAETKNIMAELEEAEGRLAIPVEELAGAFHMLGGTLIGKYGASLKQSTEMTIHAAEMGKVLGQSTEQVGMSITRILETRNIRGVDPISQFFRRTLGAAKDLKKMSPDKLMSTLTGAMTELGPAAEKMSQGFGGTMFRLEDFIKDTLRDIGIPTFKFIAGELETWRKNMEAMLPPGQKISDVLGGKVLAGVKMLREGIGFIVDNWKVLAALVGGFTLSKLIGEAASFASKMSEGIGAITTLSSALSGGAGGAGKGLLGSIGAVTSAMGPLAIAAGLASAAVLALVGWLEKRKDAEIAAMNQMGGASDSAMYLGKGQTAKALRALSRAGLVDAQGNLQGAAIREKLRTGGEGVTQQWAQGLGMNKATSGNWSPDVVAEAFSKQFERQRRQNGELWKGLGVTAPVVGDKLGDKTKPDKPVVNNTFTGAINIQQKFEEADPDNVYVRFAADLENAALSRTQSPLINPYGG